MHDVINTVADSGSVFTIQPMFGQSLITCFARLSGRPIAIVANPVSYTHLTLPTILLV